MKKSTHSKLKNTLIVFETLTKQVAADTLAGKSQSPALSIIQQYFKPKSLLASELVLYQTLVSERYRKSENAKYLLGVVLGLRNKLNRDKLRDEKYNLIREVKKHYDLDRILRTPIADYRLYASIYRVFEGVSISKAAEVARSRNTIVEHLTRKTGQPRSKSTETSALFESQDRDIQLLSLRIMIDSFNEKYSTLSEGQRDILRRYINRNTDRDSGMSFIREEATKIGNTLKEVGRDVGDKVISIKVEEVSRILDKINTAKVVSDDHVYQILLFHELVEELGKK